MNYKIRFFRFGFHVINRNTGEILFRVCPGMKRALYISKGGWRD